MKVRNISNKVFGAGDVTILPNEEKEIPKEYEKSASLEAYERAGLIVLVRDEKPAEKEEVKEEATEEEKAEAEEKPKKTRKKSK